MSRLLCHEGTRICLGVSDNLTEGRWVLVTRIIIQLRTSGEARAAVIQIVKLGLAFDLETNTNKAAILNHFRGICVERLKRLGRSIGCGAAKLLMIFEFLGLFLGPVHHVK